MTTTHAELDAMLNAVRAKHPDVKITVNPPQASPFRRYIQDLRNALQVVRSDLAEARRSAVYLWPFVWRATLDDAVESAHDESFELGRWNERHHADRMAERTP
jgi:hypothetical protein